MEKRLFLEIKPKKWYGEQYFDEKRIFTLPIDMDVHNLNLLEYIEKVSAELYLNSRIKM